MTRFVVGDIQQPRQMLSMWSNAAFPAASGRLCAAVAALPPEHFSLTFVFVEMFACTAMVEGPLRLRRDRYSEYRLAATCRQALGKCALVAPDKNGAEFRFGDSGRMALYRH